MQRPLTTRPFPIKARQISHSEVQVSTYAVDHDGLPIDPPGVLPCKECDDGSNILGLADAFLRVHVLEGRDQLRALPVAEHLSVDRPWRNAVDSDAARAKILGEDARELLNCAFRRGVDDVRWGDARHVGGGRGEEYDTAAWSRVTT